MLTPKDYITLTLSAIALCLSLYNFYRSRKDARAADIRTIERKRFEAIAITADARASKLRAEAALEAVRFDALLAHDAELVKMVDGQLSLVRKLLDAVPETDEDVLGAVGKGPLEELLLKVETFVGNAGRSKSNAAEIELTTTNLIADARRKLLAASLGAP
jgi:hypothetical protein